MPRMPPTTSPSLVPCVRWPFFPVHEGYGSGIQWIRISLDMHHPFGRHRHYGSFRPFAFVLAALVGGLGMAFKSKNGPGTCADMSRTRTNGKWS